MNMRRLCYVTLKCLRQFAFVMALSLFVVLICVKIQAETYEYDALNRVTKVIYDDQSYTVYKYDANGNIISQNYYDNGQKEESGSGTIPPTEDDSEENDTEDKKDTPIQENPAKQHKNGMKAQNKNATYVITSVKKKTASFYRLKNKKKTSYTVPNTVKIDGITYKVTKISSKAFKGKSKLKKVTIGKNVTSIGKQAFYGCKKLKTIVIKTTKLKAVGKQALKGIYKKAVIKVPKAKYKKYKKLLKGKGQKNTVKIKKG